MDTSGRREVSGVFISRWKIIAIYATSGDLWEHETLDEAKLLMELRGWRTARGDHHLLRFFSESGPVPGALCILLNS